MRRFLFWLTARLPCRFINDKDHPSGKPYLQRYYLCSFLGLTVYIHRFLGSDPDRGLHSHPWKWALSILLSGWYYEERFTGDTSRPGKPRVVRWLNFLMGESFHRVVMPADGASRFAVHELYGAKTIPTECWTLFIHRASRARKWGFIYPADRAENFTFEPFKYPGGAPSLGNWWEKAPKGRDYANR